MKHLHTFFGRLAILMLAAFLLTSMAFAQETGIIEGRVIDKTTQQEVIGATVQVLGTSLGAVTDVNGNFTIKGLAANTYSLKFSAVEYKPFLRTDVRVSSSQSTKLTVELSIDAYQQTEVVVIGTRTFDKSEDTRVSSNQISQEEIRRAPGAAEDVSRMMQSLPGVTFGSDSRNDIIARGGSPIENFVMIDGIEVPNINHYGTQGASGGPIGMINTDFLNDVNFSAGGFGAKYGDRLSSIMDIKYRNGDERSYHGKFDMGLAGFGGIFEGPIQTEKSAFMVSVRRSYLDLFSGGIGLTGVPKYWNFNLKGTFELTPQHSLTVIGLGGIDNIENKNYDSNSATAVSNTDLIYDGWQYVMGFSHRWLIDKNTFLRTSVSSNAYNARVSNDSIGVGAGNSVLSRTLDFSNTSTDRELVLRSDFSHRFSARDLLEVGITAKHINNHDDIFVKAGTDITGTNPDIFITADASATKLGAYSQYTRNFTDKFSATLGLRWDYFDYISDKNAVSPRLSLSYDVTNQVRFNLGGGFYQQAPPLIWLVADERNRDTKFMKTYQAVAGVEYFPQEDLKISVEVYAKEYRDYPISTEHPQYVYSSAGADFSTPFEQIRSGSDGYARGIEFFVHKKLTDHLYGMVNYSYSSIMFKDGLGTWRPSAFNYRNSFTLTGGYKLNESFEFSAKFRYAGGRPYTPFDLQASTSRNQGILDYTRVNEDRFKDYKRLDVRADYRFGLLGWNMIAFVDLENMLNVKNVDQLVWNNKTNQPDQLLQWQFLPVGGIKMEF
jgi:outer membrane receptor for ferrienterochelin and colicin